MTVQFASAFSEQDWLDDAIKEACEEIKSKLDGPIGFCQFFASGFPSVVCFESFGNVAKLLGTENVIGSNCEGVVHDGVEYEGSKNFSLVAGCLPDAKVDAFHLKYTKTAEGAAFSGLPEELDWPADSTLFVLADPMTFPSDILLHRLNQDRPNVRVFGGMCSGAFGNESFVGDPRQNSLSVIGCGQQSYRDGAVMLRVSGARIHSVVSQGCRPIGEPMVITDCERNEIMELGGKPALEQLGAIFQQLPARDQKVFQNGLHIGRAMSEYKEKFGYGDFLIRNLTHVEQDSGVIAANEFFRKGQTIQFHLRDQHSADADLSQLLGQLAKLHSDFSAAVVYLCNGRGMNLFDQPNHDMSLVQSKLGEIPAAGFFAAGEIGPVAGENHVHGFTFVAAVFSQ